MTRNLEQIRAANALAACRDESFAGREGGEVAKKVPAYIRINGFLCTAAYAYELKGGGYQKLFNFIAQHLSHREIDLLQADTLEGMLQELVDGDSAKLRLVTAEAMAFLNYIRRFASKG
jgi:CRISPR/Cas system CMR-associated protein Cmr5 small subunit